MVQTTAKGQTDAMLHTMLHNRPYPAPDARWHPRTIKQPSRDPGRATSDRSAFTAIVHSQGHCILRGESVGCVATAGGPGNLLHRSEHKSCLAANLFPPRSFPPYFFRPLPAMACCRPGALPVPETRRQRCFPAEASAVGTRLSMRPTPKPSFTAISSLRIFSPPTAAR